MSKRCVLVWAMSAAVLAAAVPSAHGASLRFKSSGSGWTLRISTGGGLGVCDPWGGTLRTSSVGRAPSVSDADRWARRTGHESETTPPSRLRLSARRVEEGRIVVSVSGTNPCADFKTSLLPEGRSKGAPVFRLENRRPLGASVRSARSFTLTSGASDEDSRFVRVVVGDRTHRVRVR